jgi:drug/metabolite transporter (DMT)-like permease
MLTTWLMVCVRIVANPFSNVFQKVLTRRSADPLFIILATHALLTLLCLPLCLRFGRGLPQEFWVNIFICAALAVAGNAMIVQALKLSDLSVLGPINSYKPIVSLVPGIFLLREIPSAGGLAGIGLIVAGSYFLVDRRSTLDGRGGLARLFRDRGVQYRLGGLVLSAVEAVFLKKALLASSPLITFIFWAMLGFGVSLAAMLALAGGSLGREIGTFKAGLREYGLLCLTTGLMQYCTLASFEVLQVGYALALFQTSAILSVILGYRLFQERHFLRRLTGSAIMVGGAALIVWQRH